MNIGTLYHYAKEYDKQKYDLYFNYYININKMTKGALTIAECISPKLERHLKWSNEKWFMFYKKRIYALKQKNHHISLFR